MMSNNASSISSSSSSSLKNRKGVAAVLDNFDRYEKESSNEKQPQDDEDNENYPSFTVKYTKSCKNNPLCGICMGQWFQLLWTRRSSIDFKTYWPRVLMLTILSGINSVLGWIEWILYEKEIQQQVKLLSNPVFIIGHPRTGTTLLQSLLGLDIDQFAICSTFCGGFPSSFLWFETIGKICFANVIDESRPMDNMPLHFDLPQEDELATNALTAGYGISPYMMIWFMDIESTFRPYFAFDNKNNNDGDNQQSQDQVKTRNDDVDVDDETLPEKEMMEAKKIWTDAFLYVLKKLTLRAQKRQPTSQNRLLLKSPVHTARMKLLLQLFPQAQFIYIHRHPYDVFRSAVHMADTTYWYTYFSIPTSHQIEEFILRQYEILWDRYQEGKQYLQTMATTMNDGQQDPQEQPQPKQLIEVSYDELTKDPIQTLERIYMDLGWEMSTSYQGRLNRDLAGRESYQKNFYRPLSSKRIRKILHERWGPSFHEFGYKMEADDE